MILNFFTGWPMPTRRDKWITGWSAAVVLWVVVGEAAPPTAADPPDAEFLEFLGLWSSGDDQPKWVDPFQLGDPMLLESDQTESSRTLRDRHDEPRQKTGNDDNLSRQPLPSLVRPGEGTKP